MARGASIRGARPLRTLVAAMAAGAILCSALFGVRGSAHAVEDEAPPAPQPALVIAPETPVFAADDEELRVQVLLQNPGEESLPAGTLTLELDNDRAETAEAIYGDAETDGTLIASEAVARTPAGENQQLVVTIERSAIPLAALRANGVYGLRAVVTFDEAEGDAETGVDAEAADTDTPADAETGLQGDPATEADTGTGNGAVTDTEADTEGEPLPAESEINMPEDGGEGFSVTASSAVVWGTASAEQPVSLTLVVPLVLPASITTLPTSEQLSSLSPGLTALVDAAEQHFATLAVDPRILAAIRSLGSRAPGNAQELLERIETTSVPVFLLQYADADPAVQAALGYDSLLQPIGLSYATRLGDFPSTNDAGTDGPGAGGSDTGGEAEAGDDDSTLAGTGTDTDTGPEFDTHTEADLGTETDTETNTGTDADTGEAVDVEEDAAGESTEGGDSAADGEDPEAEVEVPTLTELTTLEGAIPGAWPAEGEVDGATLELLRGAGLTNIVLSSENVTAATTARVTLGSFEVLVADAPLSAAASATIAGATSTERAAGTSELAARLALAAQAGSPGLVLGLDRGVIAESADPLRIFDALDSFDWATEVSERLQPGGTAELRAGTSTEERRELLRAYASRSVQIDELAPLLANPEYLPEYQRERLLAVFATRYSSPDIDFAEIEARFRERDEELLQGVQPVTTEHTQLVGTSSLVPITLTNSLPFDALVTLRATPTSAAIALTERNFETEIAAESSKSVLVPVDSRVSSGNSALLLEVRDRIDNDVFTTGLQRLVLRTTLETILLVSLGSGAVLLFGFGIWRSVRRKRRSATEPALPDFGE